MENIHSFPNHLYCIQDMKYNAIVCRIKYIENLKLIQLKLKNLKSKREETWN